MNEAKLRTVVTQAVCLDREIRDKQEELKAMTDLIIQEANGRPEEQAATDGGGTSWTAEGTDGCVVRVNFPGPSLKSNISGEGETIDKLREVAGKFFTELFQQKPSYAPIADFRVRAEQLLGKSSAKLIKLTTTESAARVSFETKEGA